MNSGRAWWHWFSTRRGVKTAIVLFNAILIGILWYAVFDLVRGERQNAIQAAVTRNDNLVIVFEQYTIRTIESADAVIQYLIREYVRTGRRMDLEKLVADFTIDNKAIVGMVLADERGNARTTAYSGKSARSTNLADREHFRVHIERDSGKVFIGKPVLGRVAGQWVIPITRRINNADGSFGGVAMALIEPGRFTDVLHDAKLRPLDIISLVGLEGVTRARLTGTKGSWGQDISKSQLFAEQAKRPVGNYFAKGQLDNVPRFFSYRTLSGYQVMTTVGTAEADVMAEFYSRRTGYFWAAGLTSAGIAGFAALLLLLLAAQRRAAASVTRSQALLRLEHAVTGSLAEADSVLAALTEVIRAICTTERWECGRYFRVDEEDAVLRFDASWGVPEPSIQRFLERSNQRAAEIAYKPGVGLMGVVWQSGQPLWVADVTRDTRALAAAFTVDVGIRGGFVFPVISEGRTIGVLAFNSREVRDPEAPLLQSILAIGGQIGQFLQRKAAEEEQRLFRLALENSADMILLIDRKTMRYVDVNQTACKLLGYSREELLKLGPQDLLPEGQGELTQAHDELIADPSGASGMRSYFRCKDGSALPFESTRHVLRSGGRHIVAAICRDIRERLAAEEAQRQQVALIAESADKDRLLRLFYELPFVGLAVTSPSSKRWLQVNDYMCVMLGYPREELLELAWTQTTHPDDLAANLALFKRLSAGELDAFQLFKRFVRKDGVIVDTSTEVRCVRREDGSVETVVIMVQDISERKRAEEAQRQSEARFRSLTELSSDMYWELDDQYRFTSISETGSEKASVRGFHFVGKTRWEQDYINMSAADWAAHMAVLDARQPFHDMELCRLDDGGKKMWIGVSGEPVFDASGVFKGYRGVGKDITDRKQGEEQIHYLATHDALTSLPNRAMFSEVLNLGLQNARRYDRTFAVLFIDLDRFKIINDTLGHEAGDKLLREMGRRLTDTVRTSDLVARLGGDEFVVLVQEVSEPKQVEAVARKILSTLIKPMFIREQECRVSASIGICMFPGDAQDEQSLMKNADIAMYRAKEEGKNTYQFFSQEMNVHSFERMALETSLRRGLERSEFFLHYQPKLDLKTGRITGVEALVRWQHPDLGVIPPAQFIPLAEETGLIVRLGNWVLNTACAQNVAWQREGLPPLRMAVNLSARQFSDENLLGDIAEALRKSGMKVELLELELTESMVMQNADRAGKVLGALKRLGARLAIDDFGVGYSSLASLKRFPIDTLKVDRTFIRDIPQDAEDMAITRAIIAMGKSLKLTVVAEGVETLEQETFLREHVCDETQGYYFSRPIAADQFAELLRRNAASLPHAAAAVGQPGRQ